MTHIDFLCFYMSCFTKPPRVWLKCWMFTLLYCLPAFAWLSKRFPNSVFKGALWIEVYLFINIPCFFVSSFTCQTYILICCFVITSRAVPGMLDLVGHISTQILRTCERVHETKFNQQRVCRCSRKDDHTKSEYMCWPEAHWLPVKQDWTCPRLYDWLTLFPVKPISELITLCCEGSWEVGERSHSNFSCPSPKCREFTELFTSGEMRILCVFALCEAKLKRLLVLSVGKQSLHRVCLHPWSEKSLPKPAGTYSK